MSLLPAATSLGRLHLLETYDYYDGPKLFSVRNAVGTTFFVLWADATAEEDIWFYAPVSTERLADLRDGVVSIQDGFIQAEDRVVYRVVQEKKTGTATVTPISTTDIPRDCLPAEGDSISIPSLAPLREG